MCTQSLISDAQCPLSSVPADANAANDAASSGKTSWSPAEVVTYTCSAHFQVVTGSGVADRYTRICTGSTFATASPGSCESKSCICREPICNESNIDGMKKVVSTMGKIS